MRVKRAFAAGSGLVALVLSLVLVGGAVAAGTPAVTYYGCLKAGLLYAVGTAAPKACWLGGTVISWNQAGSPGTQGPAGPAGANGATGATIRSGDGAPAPGAGSAGDFYLDTKDSGAVLYGPKSDQGWPAVGTSLTGAAGPAGADGHTIYSGLIPPAVEIGAVGDLYLDTGTVTLYGPKTDQGWPSGISLVGPAGPQGTQGPQGDSAVLPVQNVVLVGELVLPGVTSSGPIDIYGFDWTVTRTSSPGSHTTGSLELGAFTLVRHADGSSPAMYSAAAAGRAISNATITLVRADAVGRHPFLTFTLAHALVASVVDNPGAPGGNTETISIEPSGTVTVSATDLESPPPASIPAVGRLTIAGFAGATALPVAAGTIGISTSTGVTGTTMRVQHVMGRVLHPTDTSTAHMLSDFLQTSHYPSGELEIGQPPFDQPTQQYSFVEVYPTAMHVAATGAQGSGPTEELSFDYQKFTTLAGADTFCWDFTTNHSC